MAFHLLAAINPISLEHGGIVIEVDDIPSLTASISCFKMIRSLEDTKEKVVRYHEVK